MCCRWLSTVRVDRNSRSAMSRLDRPCPARSATSCSRSLNGSSAHRPSERRRDDRTPGATRGSRLTDCEPRSRRADHRGERASRPGRREPRRRGARSRTARTAPPRGRATRDRQKRCPRRARRGPGGSALSRLGELGEAIDDGLGVAEPRDVVEQRRLHRELAEAPRVVGRDAKQLARRRKARPLGGEPRMGTVDVGVEQTALADFELGHAVEVDSRSLAIALEQLSARDEGERPPLGRAETEATVGADERDQLRALISGTPHRRGRVVPRRAASSRAWRGSGSDAPWPRRLGRRPSVRARRA